MVSFFASSTLRAGYRDQEAGAAIATSSGGDPGCPCQVLDLPDSSSTENHTVLGYEGNMKSVPSTSRPRISIVYLLTSLTAAGGACRSTNVTVSGGACGGSVDGGDGGGGSAGGKGGGAGTGTGGLLLVLPDARSVDACVPAAAPAACTAPGGSYCGLIGDGCRGQIDCGNNCPAGWTCDIADSVCVGGADCRPTYQCDYTVGSTSGSYCGKISDGCGHALTCGDPCASLQTGWLCENNLCVGGASVCIPASCDPVPGTRYCGKVGDGCGRGIDCGDNCASLQPGWVCNAATNSCVGGADCKKLVCDGESNARYCGKVGDGCGGTVDCGDTCSAFRAGWVCDTSQGLCAGGPSCVRTACTVAGGGQYCGDIGDGCGGTLHCGDCPGSGTCSNNVCPGLGCGSMCAAQLKCSSGTTSITGTVYDPAGKVPLYNVIVYVPDAPLAAISTGASCDTCSASVSGKPITTALTDSSGNFTLNNVPVGVDFPLVMQVGKWRRQVTIKASEVSRCATAAIADASSGQDRRLRLPRSKNEGSIPKMAITAGDADRLQCLFTRMGIDTVEFTNPDGAGSINIYEDNYSTSATAGYDSGFNNGALWPSANVLWSNIETMMKYDVILMACGGSNERYEGDKTPLLPDANGYFPPDGSGNILTDAMKLNMVQYVNNGGRTFAEHYHWGWLRSYPPRKDSTKYPCVAGGTANPCSIAPDGHAPFGEVATWDTGGSSSLGTNITALVDTSFPKGQAFGQWLVSVGASTTQGSIVLGSDVKSTALATLAGSQQWIYQTTPSSYVHYFTFNAPVGEPAAVQCGRFVFTGLHVSTAVVANPDPKDTFPSNCVTRDLSAPEKALEFMMFDLTSCLMPDSAIPAPPPVGGSSAPPTPPQAGGAPPTPVPPAPSPPPPPPFGW